MSSKSEKVDVARSKKKNKLSSKRQKHNYNNDLYDLNVISSLSGSLNRDHGNMEENVCRISSSLEEKSQMTSLVQTNFRGEHSENDTQFKTSALEDSLAEIFVSKNKPEKVERLSKNYNHVNNISEPTNHEKENVVKDNSLSCPLCWKSYNEKEQFLGHIKICGRKHNKSAKWLLEALQLQERQKAEREAFGLPNILHVQSNKKRAAVKKSGNTKGDANLQLALALSASLKDAEDIERLDQEQCLLELGVEEEVIHQQQNTLEKFCFTNSRPVLVPVNPRAKNVNKNGNYVLLKRTQVDRENILGEKVTRLLAESEKVKTELNDYNEEIIICDYLQKYHRKDDILWHKACDSSDNYQQDYYVHKLSDFITPCTYAAGSNLKYFPQYSTNNEVSEIKCPAEQRNVAEVKVVESSSEKTPSTSTVKNNNMLTKIFISNWKCILNKKALSDITIFVDKGKTILAHKLVFHARCPLVLKDIIKEEGAKNESQDMLMWLEVPQSAALAFLEYIYCSSTNKIFTLRKSELASLRKLLQRYHVRDLFPHLKLAKSIRTKSNSISQGYRGSLEGGGYLNSESPVKKHQSCNISEVSPSLSFNSSNTNDALITKPENEKICSNTSIRSESPDLFREENSESFLTDTCHEKDRQSQESSRADIDFLVSLLDKSSPKDHVSVMLNKPPKTLLKQADVINNTPYKTQKLLYTKVDLQNNYKQNLEMEYRNGKKQNKSAAERQILSSPIKNNTETQISPNNTIKSCQEDDLQKKCSPLKADCFALSSLPDSDAECSNRQPTEIVFKHSDSLEEHFLKHSAENSHLDYFSPQIVPNNSLKTNTQAEIHKMSVSEQEDSSGDQSPLFVKSSCRNSSRSSCESPNYAYIKKTSKKSETPHRIEHKLEHLNSRVHSSTPIKLSSDQTSLENKRKHSESSSSSTDTPKKMRGEQTHVEHCEKLEAKALDTSTTARYNTDSGLKEQLNVSLSENDGIRRITCSITFDAIPGKVDNQSNEKDDKLAKRESKSPNGDISDKEWDSFDEICHASPVGIFSLPLTSHLKDKTPVKENETVNQGALNSKPITVADNSFLASLNESLLWREENAPEALCKTPQNTRMADDVTPPVDYNILRTAEIKKELRKYGLKSSLTKKQARTMLQYIYDQLHPWISDTEETSTSVSTQPEFKLPCNSSPIKYSCSPQTKASKDPVRRSLLESCSQQEETGSESESELPLSQQSFSSTSSALSEIITAEEIHSDIQEDNVYASQEVLSAQELKTAVHKFILSNQDLHQKILLGEPFMINDLHATLKSTGFKCKINNLMDYLDEQCITFRTLQQQGNRRRGSSKNKTKKTKYIQKNKKKGTASFSLS